ncbi:MAG: hypothetical protein LRY52_10400 [Sulfurospirillum cavolei]|nr:hypothetical protein [Sulfurospirillum cavolei]
MNKEELKTLWGFLIVYVASALILMVIIAILYYRNETYKINEKRLMEIKTVIMGYEKELMRAEMDKVSYAFHPPKEFFSVALLNREKQPLFSNFKNQIVDVNATRYAVRELATPINEVAYIVVDEAKSEQELFTLKFIIFLSIFISAIFVGIEGYFLSRFLLKPVHSRIENSINLLKTVRMNSIRP